MSIDSVLEISEKVNSNKVFLTRRENHFIKLLYSKVEERLNTLISKDADSTRLVLSYSSGLSDTESIRSGVELILTLFHRTCQLYLSSILALEIVNRYLGKTPPAVDRALNNEELSVLALVVTLIISELREEGITGIYLRDAGYFESEIFPSKDDLILEETNCKQLLIIRVEAATLEQVRERAKLVLLENSIEQMVLGTSHAVNLEIDAEVRSFSTLLSLRPGLKWRVGREVPLAILIDGDLVGYGELQIKNK